MYKLYHKYVVKKNLDHHVGSRGALATLNTYSLSTLLICACVYKVDITNRKTFILKGMDVKHWIIPTRMQDCQIHMGTID